jgi:hypothetical protein
MAKGSKSSYTKKQKRQAKDIYSSVKKGGVSKKTAERIAWATVNKRGRCARKSTFGSRANMPIRRVSVQRFYDLPTLTIEPA